MTVTDEVPRPLTSDEMCASVIDYISYMVHYWEREGDTPRAKLEGLAHSILTALDGAGPLPAFDLVPSPHPDDQEFARSEGDNWVPTNSLPINSGVYLHELFAETMTRSGS